jgi:hypothetical protein
MSFFYFLSKNRNILFKNLLLNLPFFIFCKKSFSEILFFGLILSPIWPCAILCASAILCAPTVCSGKNYNSVAIFGSLVARNGRSLFGLL